MAETTTITIRASIVKQSTIIKTYIDDGLVLTGPGTINVNLENGKTHYLAWFVTGNSGDSYTIAITAPPSLVFSNTATLDEDKKDYGVQRIAL